MTQVEVQDELRVLAHSLDWNSVLHRPLDEITQEEARRRDAVGRAFTVTFGSAEQPEVTLKVMRGHGIFTVTWLDEHLREALLYNYTRQDDGRLFLDEITTWTYDRPDALAMSQAATIEELRWRPDGYVDKVFQDSATPDRESLEQYRNVPVESHWEDEPAFGDWDGLLVWDRDAEGREETR